MTYEEAKDRCHVRSGIFRHGKPTKVFTQEDLDKIHPELRDLSANRIGMQVPRVFWKNHPVPLDERVPQEDKLANDWAEYDPREREECSRFNEMPA